MRAWRKANAYVRSGDHAKSAYWLSRTLAMLDGNRAPRRRKYIDAGCVTIGNSKRHLMALPAYDQCIKASHVFNLLDARGVISVTERQSYILRVRELAKACGEAWLATEAGGAAV